MPVIVLFVTLDYWTLHWGKTDSIQFTPVVAFRKGDYPLVWKLVEYTVFLIIRPIYEKTFVAKEASKLQMQVRIGRRFHLAEIIYFKINRLYAYNLHQADYMWRNSVLIKVSVKNKLVTKNWTASSGPRAHHPRFLCSIFNRNLHPQFLTRQCFF